MTECSTTRNPTHKSESSDGSSGKNKKTKARNPKDPPCGSMWCDRTNRGSTSVRTNPLQVYTWNPGHIPGKACCTDLSVMRWRLASRSTSAREDGSLGGDLRSLEVAKARGLVSFSHASVMCGPIYPKLKSNVASNHMALTRMQLRGVDARHDVKHNGPKTHVSNCVRVPV